MIALGRDVCGDFTRAAGREWLETNGRGSYALGTVSGASTRRYHGLLNAALRPPVGRFQAVNRLEESLDVDGARHVFSRQTYPGALAPDPLPLEEFRLDPFPVWIHSIAGTRLKKSFFLRYGEDTAVVLYEHLAGPPAVLEVRPLLSGRNHHHLGGRAPSVRASAGGFSAAWPELPAFHVVGDGAFREDPAWYRRQSYAVEERRGLDFIEDVHSPGSFRWALPRGGSAALVFSTSPRDPAEAPVWAEQERRLRSELLERSPLKGPLGRALTLAADQFLVARGNGMSVIAGYPWFEDWGRDAMISLPGLCLSTGRADDAEKVLDVWAAAVRDGRLPNRFSDEDGRPEGFAVDAGLWMVWAVQQYLRATRDEASVRRWRPTLWEVVDAVEKGDRKGVHMDRDGLVVFPADEAPLTWMDARVDGSPVTPRAGKPVEIQALWYNALEFLAELDLKWGGPSRGYEKLAAIARTSFNDKFWNEREDYPYDHLEGRGKDPAVRPNALLSVSLPYEILDARRFKVVVDRAEREFLTPLGLRTLSPSDAAYRGRHAGPPSERDRAYHQGTAWPWLLGPFLTAYAKAYGSSSALKLRLLEALKPMGERVLGEGLGLAPEVADGDAPHAPGGCPAQAWSVAEMLRVMREENLPL